MGAGLDVLGVLRCSGSRREEEGVVLALGSSRALWRPFAEASRRMVCLRDLKVPDCREEWSHTAVRLQEWCVFLPLPRPPLFLLLLLLLLLGEEDGQGRRAARTAGRAAGPAGFFCGIGGAGRLCSGGAPGGPGVQVLFSSSLFIQPPSGVLRKP